MIRILSLVIALLLAAVPVQAKTCREKVAPKAATLFHYVAKQYESCGKKVALGKDCGALLRDAKVASKIGKTREAAVRACADADAVSLGFTDAGALAIAVAGVAAGEGRQIADAVYGRVPVAHTKQEKNCASMLVKQSAKAGKAWVKRLMGCGSTCGSQAEFLAEAEFAKAKAKIEKKCDATLLTTFAGGDLDAHLDGIRDAAQRVVDSLSAASAPVVSFVDPANGALVSATGLPFDLDIEAAVSNVPHAGYVNSMKIGGEAAQYDPLSGSFEASLNVASAADTNLALFAEARTTLGTISGTANVTLDLGTLAPDVVLTFPASGTITSAGTIGILGQVVGDLSEADILRVNGVSQAFDGSSGIFSATVTLNTDAVQIIEAEVSSSTFGTDQSATLVILHGTGWPIGDLVPDANFNRLNNSGLNDLSGLMQDTLDDALSFSALNGMSAGSGGGHVCAFSLGSSSLDLSAVGAATVQSEVRLNSFHIKICDHDIGIEDCDITYDATRVDVLEQGNLHGQLAYSSSSTSATFTGGSATLSAGFFCTLGNLGTPETAIEAALADVFDEELPAALDSALAGIVISDALGAALDLDIDASYASIIEDSDGITFTVDSNITPISTSPGMPVITETFIPLVTTPPSLGPTVPGTGESYDLAFCLVDAFMNRALAAFMMRGDFSNSLTEYTVTPGDPSTTVDLSTAILWAYTGDIAYQDFCPGCDVTLTFAPTAAPVTRQATGGEDGSLVLIVPNYEVSIIADDGGTPASLVTAQVLVELPLSFEVSTGAIVPDIGTLSVQNVRVAANAAGLNEALLADTIREMLAGAGDSLGSVFSQIPLPSFQGLSLVGVDSGYENSCTALYLDLE